MAIAKDLYDVRINDQGFILATSPQQPARIMERASVFENRFAQGDRSELDFSDWWQYIQTDWSGGWALDQDRWKDNAKFFVSNSGDVLTKTGQISPAYVGNQKTGITGNDVGNFVSSEFNGAAYYGSDDTVSSRAYLYKQTATDGNVTAVADATPLLSEGITGMDVGENLLIIAEKTQVRSLNTSDTLADLVVTGGTALDTNDPHPVKLFRDASGTAVYVGNGHILLKLTAINATAATGADVHTFSAETVITKLEVYNNELYIATKRFDTNGSSLAKAQLWKMQADATLVLVHEFQESYIDCIYPYQGRGTGGQVLMIMTGSSGFFYTLNTSGDLNRFGPVFNADVTTFDANTPGSPSTNFRVAFSNQVAEIDGIAYFGAYDKWTNSTIIVPRYNSSIFQFDGIAFSKYNESATNNLAINGVLAFKGTASNVGLNWLNKDQKTTSTTASFLQSWDNITTPTYNIFTFEQHIFDGGSPNIDKYFYAVLVTFVPFGDGGSLTIRYKLDDASSYTNLVLAALPNSGDTSYIAYFPANTTGKRLKLRISLGNNDTTDKDILKSINTLYLPLPDYKHQWRLNLKIQQNMTLKDGNTQEIKNPKTLRNFLWDLLYNKQAIDFEDIDYFSFTLNDASFTASSTTIAIDEDTDNVAEQGIVKMGSEWIKYTAKKKNNLDALTRAYRNTIAASASDNSAVEHSKYRVIVTEIQEKQYVSEDPLNPEWIISLVLREV